ncbi:hypothetical protein BH24BAC1_BH24BAC1_20590 [soil metagenome]
MRNRLWLIVDRVKEIGFTDRSSLTKLYFLNQQANLAVWAMYHKTHEIKQSWIRESDIQSLFDLNRRNFLMVFKGRPEDMEAGFNKVKQNLIYGLKFIISLSEG